MPKCSRSDKLGDDLKIPLTSSDSVAGGIAFTPDFRDRDTTEDEPASDFWGDIDEDVAVGGDISEDRFRGTWSQ